MMKNLIVVAIAAMVFGFMGVSQVSAGKGPGPCPENCRLAKQNCATQNMGARNEAHEKFMADTKEIRKEMMVTQAKMRVLMTGDDPDIAKAGELAGHLFDLKDKLQAKKAEIGLDCSCCGCGMGCSDRGKGYGCRGERGCGPRCRM